MSRVNGLVIIINKSRGRCCSRSSEDSKSYPYTQKDDASLPGSYRPISLSSVFDKILEKVICTSLRKFMRKHNILSLDENKFVFGVYIDLKKHLIQLITIFFYQNYNTVGYLEMP